LKDVYFDCLRLCDELDHLPPECDCRDPGAHLAGECCCASPVEVSRESGSSSEGCKRSLETLRRTVGVFQKDVERERPRFNSEDLTAYESGKEFFLIEDTIRFIREAIERVEGDLEEFRATCAHSALLRLKKRSGDLRKYLERLNNPSLRQPNIVHQKSCAQGSDVPLSEITTGMSPALHDKVSRSSVSRESLIPAIEVLKAIAQKHDVCYEVWPEWSFVGNERVKIGFVLELYGANEHEDGRKGCHMSPGCRICRETFEELKKIAEWIMPQEERISRYEIEPFNRMLHIAPKQRKLRSEVVLTVKILHRHEINQPVDECEQMCLKEMRDKLAELGVLEGRLQLRSASQPLALHEG
jgi:hypothetical protein